MLLHLIDALGTQTKDEKKKIKSLKEDIPESKTLLISNLDFNLTKEYG